MTGSEGVRRVARLFIFQLSRLFALRWSGLRIGRLDLPRSVLQTFECWFPPREFLSQYKSRVSRRERTKHNPGIIRGR
jgi:hypothetical protein